MNNVKRFWNYFKYFMSGYVKGGLIGFLIGIPICAIIVIVAMIFGVI